MYELSAMNGMNSCKSTMLADKSKLVSASYTSVKVQSRSRKRFVYVQTNCGFADIVKIFTTCLRLSQLCERTFVIDTRFGCYGIDVLKQFRLQGISRSRIISTALEGVHQILQLSRNKSVVPKCISWSRFVQYTKGTVKPDSGIMDWPSRQLLRFKEMTPFILDKECEADVIFVADWGNAPNFQATLRHIEPIPHIIDLYKSRRDKLPERYASIHVRHTDIKSDIEELWRNIRSDIEPWKFGVFVATDNESVLDFFRSKGLVVHNFTKYGSEAGKALHLEKSISGLRTLSDAVIDLLLIRDSRVLFSNSKGGFNMLARSLQSGHSNFWVSWTHF